MEYDDSSSEGEKNKKTALYQSGLSSILTCNDFILGMADRRFLWLG